MNDMRLMERTVAETDIKISARDVQVYYGEAHAIKDVNIDIADILASDAGAGDVAASQA